MNFSLSKLITMLFVVLSQIVTPTAQPGLIEHTHLPFSSLLERPLTINLAACTNFLHYFIPSIIKFRECKSKSVSALLLLITLSLLKVMLNGSFNSPKDINAYSAATRLPIKSSMLFFSNFISFALFSSALRA